VEKAPPESVATYRNRLVCRQRRNPAGAGQLQPGPCGIDPARPWFKSVD